MTTPSLLDSVFELKRTLKYGGGTNKNVHSGLAWLRSIQGCVRLTTSASVSMTMGCW